MAKGTQAKESGAAKCCSYCGYRRGRHHVYCPKGDMKHFSSWFLGNTHALDGMPCEAWRNGYYHLGYSRGLAGLKSPARGRTRTKSVKIPAEA